MIETIVLNYLANVLNVPVYMEVPEDPSGSYVVLEKTGGTEENHVTRATIAAQSYAPSLVDAAKLNTLVVQALKDIVIIADVGGSHVNSDGVNFTDPTTKRYRYQCVFDLYYV